MTIDWWTLGLQAINVLILVWLLARFFWAPVATMIAERRDSIAQSLAAAEAGRAAAAAQLAAIEETRAGFTTEREAVLATARADADKEAASRLAKARQDAEDLRQEAQASLLRERQAAERQWQEQAGILAVDIAGKLVARLDDTALRRAFFNDLLHGIAALPDVQRSGLTAADASLDLTSAWPLAPAEMAEFGNALVASLGCPRPRLSTDPALIAGFELRSPHVVVGNSWKADLDRIGQDLRHAS